MKTNRNRSKYRLAEFARSSAFRSIFGRMRGTVKILGDIVNPDPELWDCELGIAYRDENDVPYGYDGTEIDMIEAVKNAR